MCLILVEDDFDLVEVMNERNDEIDDDRDDDEYEHLQRDQLELGDDAFYDHKYDADDNALPEAASDGPLFGGGGIRLFRLLRRLI